MQKMFYKIVTLQKLVAQMYMFIFSYINKISCFEDITNNLKFLYFFSFYSIPVRLTRNHLANSQGRSRKENTGAGRTELYFRANNKEGDQVW